MSQRLSNEIIIDGKLMNIGKSSAWRDEIFQINYGVDVGPDDPGNDEPSPRRVTGGSSQALDQPPRISRRPSSTELSLNLREENQIFSRSLEEAELETGGGAGSQTLAGRVKRSLRILAVILLVAAYNAYIAYAVHFHLKTGRNMDWCGGLGFLIIVTGLVYFSLFYFHILKKVFPWRKIKARLPLNALRVFNTKTGNLILNILVIVVIGVFLVIDTETDRKRLISAGGILVIITLGTLGSKSRQSIVWRHVSWGLVLQFLFGLLILRWSYGKTFFKCVGDKVRGQQWQWRSTKFHNLITRFFSLGRHIPRIH